MKTKSFVIAVLLSATNMVWANGGQSVGNVDVSNVAPTTAEITEIKVQGSTDQFNVEVENAEKVDTSSLKNSYDGRS